MYTDEQMYKAIINDTIFEAAEEFYDQIQNGIGGEWRKWN